MQSYDFDTKYKPCGIKSSSDFDNTNIFNDINIDAYGVLGFWGFGVLGAQVVVVLVRL